MIKQPFADRMVGRVIQSLLVVMALVWLAGFYAIIGSRVSLVDRAFLTLGWTLGGLVSLFLVWALLSKALVSTVDSWRSHRTAKIHRKIAMRITGEFLCGDCQHLERAHTEIPDKLGSHCTVDGCGCKGFSRHRGSGDEGTYRPDLRTQLPATRVS